MLSPASILLKILGLFWVSCSIYIYRTREKTIQYLMKRYAKCETKSEYEAAYDAFKFRTIGIAFMLFVGGLIFIIYTDKFLR